MKIALQKASSFFPIISNDIEEELGTIAFEWASGRVLRESSLFRIYKIKESDIWRKAYDYDGVNFTSWEEFLRYVENEASVSRSLTFYRIRAYKRLITGLGYDDQVAFGMMLNSPGAVAYALDNLATWHPRTGEIRGFSGNTKVSKSKNPKEALREIVEETSQIPIKREAYSHVEVDIMGVSTVMYQLQEEMGNEVKITAIVERREIDKDGEVYLSGIDEIEIVHGALPEIVLDDLCGKLKIIGRGLTTTAR